MTKATIAGDSDSGEELMKSIGKLDVKTKVLKDFHEKDEREEDAAVNVLTQIGKVILKIFGI